MSRVLTDLQLLVQDIYAGNVGGNYSNVSEAEDKIREAVINACGGEWNLYNFQANKWSVFKIMAEALDVVVEELLEEQFNEFVEIHNVNLGDTIEFTIEDQSLFKVASIARGMTDINRQRLDAGKLTVYVEKLAVKIYAEWDRFVTGRVDFGKLVERVAKSFSNEIGTRVYNCIYDSYDGIRDTYKFSGSFDAEALSELITHVEAASGQPAVIYGTAKSLRKVTEVDAMISDNMRDTFSNFGIFGKFRGTAMIKLPQVHVPKQTEVSALASPNDIARAKFAVNDSWLLVLPSGEKIVKMVLEGQAMIIEQQGHRADLQVEYFMSKMIGLGAVKAKIYGIYRLS